VRFKDDSSNIVVAPYSFAEVNCSEVVHAKFEAIRQLLRFKCKLDTNTKACKIVNNAMVNRRVVNQDSSRVVSLGALRSPVFCLPIFHGWSICRMGTLSESGQQSRKNAHKIECYRDVVGNSLTSQV
jgi:hypothetical protein